MRYFRPFLWAIAVAGLLAATAQAQEKSCPNEKGWRPTKTQLKQIQQAHREWVRADGYKDPAIPGRANLCNADLSGADLIDANLSGVNLSGVDLSGADLTDADLSDATLRDAKGLSTLRWSKLPLGIYKIRKDFKDAGERERERELTYAIKYNERINTGGVDGAFNYVLFEITSKYGLLPGRPLRILGILILVMTPLYWAALSTRRGTGAIWQVWPEDRTLKDQGSKEPVRLPERKFDFIWLGVYFSILSAFHIGWRDLNVGNWFARIQPREYILRATGWVRVASGLQSLVSVYLLALWVVTYFGSPFE